MGGPVAWNGIIAFGGFRFNATADLWSDHPSDLSGGFNSDGAIPAAMASPNLSHFGPPTLPAQPSVDGLSVALFDESMPGVMRVTPPTGNSPTCPWVGYTMDLMPVTTLQVFARD